MVELFNYCTKNGYDESLIKTRQSLQQFANSMELDGVEMFVYQEMSADNAPATFGVHLRYWPSWLGFWQHDIKRVKKELPEEKDVKAYYGALTPDQWLDIIRANIKEALKLNPQYLVWHISEASMEELYTMKFKYNDMQVISGAAEVFNAVASSIPANVTVLFENLWWPGLRLTNQPIVKAFFDRVNRDNVGIMLDIGHLANTNFSLKCEDDIVEYTLATVRNLGECAKYIKGIHLNKSLSGEYINSFKREFPKSASFADHYRHITNIDQHKPFTETNLEKVVRKIQPDYLVHELFYNDLPTMAKYVQLQQNALGITHDFRGEK